MISSEYGYVHYQPSVLHFNPLTTEFVESNDGNYIMLVSDEEVLPRDTITLPPNYQHLSGMTYKVEETTESDGIKYIKVNTANPNDLIVTADVSTDDKFLSISEMEIIPGDGVFLFTTFEDEESVETESASYTDASNKKDIQSFRTFQLENISEVKTEITALFDFEYDSNVGDFIYDYSLSSMLNIDQPLSKDYMNLTFLMDKDEKPDFDIQVGMGGLIEGKLSNSQLPSLSMGVNFALDGRRLTIGETEIVIDNDAVQINEVGFNFSNTPSISGPNYDFTFSEVPVATIGDYSIQFDDIPKISAGDNYITLSTRPNLL